MQLIMPKMQNAACVTGTGKSCVLCLNTGKTVNEGRSDQVEDGEKTKMS